MTEAFATFNTVFFSIILQAFPFLLLGTIISSALHIFVSDNFIVKAFPKKWGLGLFTALFIGLLFPVCECATVPVMKRLIQKGVPVPVAVTLMLAAPIINPISIMSTLYAFPQTPIVAFYRVFFGLLTALVIGILLFFHPEKHILKSEITCCHHSHDDNSHACKEHSSAENKPADLFLHTSEEFFSVGKFLIIGALFASLIRIVIPENMFDNSISTGFAGLPVQMFFAFAFSACSTSDAFIARSFLSRFSLGSVMGFLVYGPMMDIKNLFMLMSFFKKKFVIELSILITVVNIMAISILTSIFL